jgi:hypothetical protein
MALIETIGLENEGNYSIQASHQEKEICPTFSVRCRPDRGNEEEASTHFAYTPPAEVTFVIGNARWTCVPGDSPRRLSGGEGVTYQIDYIPKPMYLLRYGRYGKNVVWISCPQWQYDQYMQGIDTDEYQVFHKVCDVYTSDGFTVNEVIEKLENLIELDITSKLPPLHLPQPSIMLSKEQIFSNFINTLLPSGFTYVWDLQFGKFVLALAEPSTEDFILPPGVTHIDYDSPAVVNYNSVTITGAPYKINSGITLDTSAFGAKLGSVSSSRFLQTIEETLPKETQEVDGQSQTTQTVRSIRTDPDGNPFAVLSETTEVTGPIFNALGVQTSIGLLKRTITTNTYENGDAIVFQVPRLVESEIKSSGYITKLSPTEVGAANGTVYYLTDELNILSRTEYLALSPSFPTILCSAYTWWVDDYETIVETKTYVQPSSMEVTKDWPEGYEKGDTRQITRQVYSVGGVYYDCLEDTKTVLQKIAQQLQNESSPSIGSTTASSRTVEMNTRKFKIESPGSYSFEDTLSTFNQVAGRMENETQTTRINSTPPSNPTQYRTEPLKATVGEKGEKLVYGTSGQIPTANPVDFQAWGGQLYYILTQVQKAMTITVRNYVIPQGYRIGNGTVTGWTISLRGGESQVQMTII